jgi:hypothetical protein
LPAASTGSVQPTGDLVGVEAETAANLQVGDPPLGHESPHVTLADLEGGGQLLEATRRRLEQPDQPKRTARHGRTAGTWQPAPRHVLESEPTEATHKTPGL